MSRNGARAGDRLTCGVLAQLMNFSSFLGVLRRRGIVIVLAVAVGAGGAYLISKGQDEKYEASTKLLLGSSGSAQSSNTQAFAGPVPDSAPDKVALVRAGPVLDRTEAKLAKSVGKARADKLVSDLEVAAAEKSAVVKITSTASTPDAAALAANTLARQNIDYRKTTSLRQIRKAIRETRRQINGLDSSNPSNAGTITALQQRLSDLRGQEATEDGNASIVSRATPPSSPASPKPARNALIGGLAGLLVGLLLAFVWEQLDRRLRSYKEMEDVFGLPVLANVPKSRALAETDGKALDQLPAREAEAFQILRANLRYLNTDKELKSIVVTSAGVGDGKSTVALNLAKADASVGKRVLLIEADIRRPRLARLLGMQAQEGLTRFLADPSVPLSAVTHSVPVTDRTNGHGSAHTLDVVVAGVVPRNPSELIDSERMRALIREGERDYDLVVLDTSPASLVADAIPLMSEATTVVIVGRVGKLTSDQAGGLREQLERIGAPTFGLVANFAGGSGRYGYGYY